jgi:hypothetical protein
LLMFFSILLLILSHNEISKILFNFKMANLIITFIHLI